MKELLERKIRLEKELETVIKALKPLAEEEVERLIADRIVLKGLYDDDEGGQEWFIVLKAPHAFSASEIADLYYPRSGIEVWVGDHKIDNKEIAGIYETAIEVCLLSLRNQYEP